MNSPPSAVGFPEGTGARRKTNPNHKASFSFGVRASCSCGWKSGTWYGKGAKGSAAGEWHYHREKCEKQEAAS